MKIVKGINGYEDKTAYQMSENVAIVGNSGKIKNSGLGQDINSFDRVVRFNNAFVHGFENDVGSKTTDLVINCHVYNDEPTLKSDGFSAWTSAKDVYKKWKKETSIIYTNIMLADKGRGSVPDDFPFFIMTKSQFKSTQHQPLSLEGTLPTIGYAFVVSLVLSGIKPTLFGFSLPEDVEWDHYFEDRPKPSISHNHNLEKQNLKAMSDHNLISIR